MKKVNLGNTGEKVSIFCLGTMYFGTSTDYGMSYKILDRYVSAGGSFLDTANIYSWWRDGDGGDSERLLGQWMKERGNRNDMFVATKVGFGIPDSDVKIGLSAKQIEKECEKSLKRLQIDTIDLYYAHKDDRNTPLEETLEAFHRLIKAGKVRYIGASNYLAWRIAEANCIAKHNDFSEYCCIQQKHTYLRPTHGASFEPQINVNNDLIDFCKNKNITLLAYSPLLSGAYTRNDRDIPSQFYGMDTDFRLSTLKQIAINHNCTLNQIILAWMIQSDPIVIPLVAGSTIEQIDENLSALDIELTYEEIYFLDTAGNPD